MSSARRARSLRAEHLGVRQPADAPARIEDHRRGHHRPCERPAARLVDPGDAREVTTPQARASVRRQRGCACPQHPSIACAARAAPSRRSARWMVVNSSRSSRTRARLLELAQAVRPPARRPCTCSWRNSGTRAPSGQQVRLGKVSHLDQAQGAQQKRGDGGRLVGHHHRPPGTAGSQASPCRRRRSRRPRPRAPRCASPSIRRMAGAPGSLRDFPRKHLTSRPREAIGAMKPQPRSLRCAMRAAARRRAAPRRVTSLMRLPGQQRDSGASAASPSARARGGAIRLQRDLIRERVADELRRARRGWRRTQSRTAAGTAPGRRPRRWCAPAPAATPRPADSRTARCGCRRASGAARGRD